MRDFVALQSGIVVLQTLLEQSLRFVAESWAHSVGSGPFAKHWVGSKWLWATCVFWGFGVLAGIVNWGVYIMYYIFVVTDFIWLKIK